MLTLAGEFQLEEFLARLDRPLQKVGAAAWRVGAGSGYAVMGTVHSRGEWIGLEFPWSTDPRESGRSLADLAGRARLVLPDAPERVAEIVGPPAEARLPRAMGPGIPVAPVPQGARAAIAVPVARTGSVPRGRAAGLGGGSSVPAGEDRAVVATGPGAGRAVAVPAGEAVADAIGERMQPGHGPAGSGLSPREMEVLRIICEGRTDREIAERLYISERTVHVHVRKVLAKLGVSSRTQAAALALRQGLVPMASGAAAET